MYSRTNPPRAAQDLEHGYSLLELILVVLILGIMAAVVVPSFFSPDPNRIDLAAEEFAVAMRYARTEAMRRGKPMGFRQQSAQKRIRVFRPDTTAAPWTPIYDVYHPVSKKLYDIQLDTHPFARADTVNAKRVYRGSCNKAGNVYFDRGGIPHCVDPETVPLQQFDVTFTLGSHTRMVSLNAITGQVSIQ